MKAISKLPRKICREINVIFSDLDDTLTLHGKIPPQAYHALWKLSRSGIKLVVVTGRPSGWADALMRLMPLSYVIAENGALTLGFDRENRRVERTYILSKKERIKNRLILDAVSSKILRKIPRLTLAADQVFRETDVAFDICEDIDHLDRQTIEKLEQLIESAGLHYKMSSIHLNAWIGPYDKRSACRKLLKRIRLETRKDPRALFIGDSPNDEPLFAGFDLSVGVANIANFTDQMKHLPAFITGKRGAEGFTQMANHILKNRR